MKQFCGMTQVIKAKKNNDFPSTGIMEKYLIGTQNMWLKNNDRVNILQTGREKPHAVHRGEHRETKAGGFQDKSCQKPMAARREWNTSSNSWKRVTLSDGMLPPSHYGFQKWSWESGVRGYAYNPSSKKIFQNPGISLGVWLICRALPVIVQVLDLIPSIRK